MIRLYRIYDQINDISYSLYEKFNPLQVKEHFTPIVYINFYTFFYIFHEIIGMLSLLFEYNSLLKSFRKQKDANILDSTKGTTE